MNELSAGDASEKMIQMSDPSKPASRRANCGGLMEFLALNPSPYTSTAGASIVRKSPLQIGLLPHFQQFLSFLSSCAVSSISLRRLAMN